jgi:GNAT superfamily N-acetyltransferase
MSIIETNNLTAEQRKLIWHLWNEEYPKQMQYQTIEEFDNYLNNLRQHYHLLALDDDSNVIGWAFLFERDNEKWFAIIVATKMQRQGIGTQLLQLLKEKEEVLNGWAADHDRYQTNSGASYPSPVQFYLKNGFIILPDIRIETEQLSAVKIKWTKASSSIRKRDALD